MIFINLKWFSLIDTCQQLKWQYNESLWAIVWSRKIFLCSNHTISLVDRYLDQNFDLERIYLETHMQSIPVS